MDYQFPDNLSNDIAKKATENGKSPDNRKWKPSWRKLSSSPQQNPYSREQQEE
jgi:hypothetical protein